MKRNGRGVRWVRRWVRRCVAVLLALAATLAVPGAWAADTKPQQQSNPAVNLHPEKKTDVDGVTSYKLGNATVKGANTSYMVIEVSSGWFTFAPPPSARLNPSSALSANGEFLLGDSVVAGAQYKYLALDSPGRDNASFAAKDLQTLLRGMTFYLDGDKEQTVSVTVTRTPPKTTYKNRKYDLVLFNENAYAFIKETAPNFAEAYSAAQDLVFLGKPGHLMTIESRDEHNLIQRLLNGENGWIGGAKKSSADAAKNDKPDAKAPCQDQDWYWVAGPSSGTKFWNGRSKPGQVDNVYAQWADGQPTNLVDECYVQYGMKKTSGAWAATNYLGQPGRDNTKRHDSFPFVNGFYVEFEQIDSDRIGRTTAATKTVAVRHELRDVTSSNQAHKVLSLTPYETTLAARHKRGFDLRSLNVSVGGRPLERQTKDVSFKRKTGKLQIPAAKVTDDVRIEMGANWLVTIRDMWSDEPLTVVRASGFTPLNLESLREKVGARDGYTLVGYTRDGAEWNFGDLVAGDMTLNPRWALDAPVVTVTPRDGRLGRKDDRVTLHAQAKLGKVRTVTFTYQWFRDGVKMPGQTASALTVSEAGEYSVEVTATDRTTKLSSQAKATAVVATPSRHTVTLRVRERDGSVTYLSVDVFHGGTVGAGALGGVSKRGYVLDGWVKADGTRFNPDTDKITSDLVISPVWKPAKRAAPLSDTGLTVVAPVVAVALLLVVAGVLAVLRWRRK